MSRRQEALELCVLLSEASSYISLMYIGGLIPPPPAGLQQLLQLYGVPYLGAGIRVHMYVLLLLCCRVLA